MSSINSASPLSAINSAFKSSRPQTASGTDRDATGQADPDGSSGTTGTSAFSPLQNIQSSTQNILSIAHGLAGGTATLSQLLAAIRSAVASGHPTTPVTPPSIGPAKPQSPSNPKGSAATSALKSSGTAVFKGNTDSAPAGRAPGTVVHTDPVSPTLPAPSGSKSTSPNAGSPTTTILPATGISDGTPTTPTTPTSPQPFSPITSVQQATQNVVSVAQSVAGGKATLSDLIAAIIKAQQSSKPSPTPTDPIVHAPITHDPSTPAPTQTTNAADAQTSVATAFPAGSFVDAAA